MVMNAVEKFVKSFVLVRSRLLKVVVRLLIIWKFFESCFIVSGIFRLVVFRKVGARVLRLMMRLYFCFGFLIFLG